MASPTILRSQDAVLAASPMRLVISWLAVYVSIGLVFFTIYHFGDPRLLTKNAVAADLYDQLSFSFVTQATIGYGDVLPQGWYRLIANIQAILGVGFNGAAIGIITFKFLKRDFPIKAPIYVALTEVSPGQFCLWFRYINTDTRDLTGVTATVFFSANGTAVNARYDAIGGLVREMRLPRIQPMLLIALYVDCADGPASIRNPDDAAMANDAPIKFHPSMFVIGHEFDRSAKLILTVSGFHSQTGELFNLTREYFSTDIVCAKFEGVDNNLAATRGRSRQQKEVEAKFQSFRGSSPDRCALCASMVQCPFRKVASDGRLVPLA